MSKQKTKAERSIIEIDLPPIKSFLRLKSKPYMSKVRNDIVRTKKNYNSNRATGLKTRVKAIILDLQHISYYQGCDMLSYNIMCTSLINSIKSTTEAEIYIITDMPEIFDFNPDLKEIIASTKCDNIINYVYAKQSKTTIYSQIQYYVCNPFIQGEFTLNLLHCIDILQNDVKKLTKHRYKAEIKPCIYLHNKELELAKAKLNTLINPDYPVILINMHSKTTQNIDLPIDLTFINKITNKYNINGKTKIKYNFIQLYNTNEDITENNIIEGAIQIKTDIREIFCLAYLSNGIICRDNYFNHMSAALGKKALVLWSSTCAKTLGYDFNINLQKVSCGNPVCNMPNHLYHCSEFKCKYIEEYFDIDSEDYQKEEYPPCCKFTQSEVTKQILTYFKQFKVNNEL